MNAISAVAEKSKLFTPAWTSVGKFWARRNCWSEDWKGVDGVILGEDRRGRSMRKIVCM